MYFYIWVNREVLRCSLAQQVNWRKHLSWALTISVLLCVGCRVSIYTIPFSCSARRILCIDLRMNLTETAITTSDGDCCVIICTLFFYVPYGNWTCFYFSSLFCKGISRNVEMTSPSGAGNMPSPNWLKISCWSLLLQSQHGERREVAQSAFWAHGTGDQSALHVAVLLSVKALMHSKEQVKAHKYPKWDTDGVGYRLQERCELLAHPAMYSTLQTYPAWVGL